MGAALAMVFPETEEFPGLGEMARRCSPSVTEIAIRNAPRIVDHEAPAGIAPGAIAIAMALWLMGWRVLWLAFASWTFLKIVDVRCVLTRMARSFRTGHFLCGTCVGAFAGVLSAALIFGALK